MTVFEKCHALHGMIRKSMRCYRHYSTINSKMKALTAFYIINLLAWLRTNQHNSDHYNRAVNLPGQ